MADTTTSPSPATPLRADARRNRAKLLASAVELFSEAPVADVSLESIARRAGVGIGTLYRHFPTRDALIEAAYRNEVGLLHDAAAELLAESPGDVALTEWLRRFVGYATAKRGMSAALHAISGDSELITTSRAQLFDAVAQLLAAGQRDGTLRADLDADDVLPAMTGIWMASEDPGSGRAERLIGLLMDGLRHRSGN
jgi:AcrR family transcriptional regulator